MSEAIHLFKNAYKIHIYNYIEYKSSRMNMFLICELIYFYIVLEGIKSGMVWFNCADNNYLIKINK